YYSEELTRKIFGELIFLSVLNIFLSVTTFLGNTLILAALPKETSLYPPSKLLFRNLAITDLCVGIIAEPLLVAYLMSLLKQRWDICYELDYAGLAIGAILCSVSLFTLTAISVDRLLALWLGLRYRRVATYIAYISVIVMWGLSVVAGAAIYSLDTVILDWSMFITISLCVVISSLCYTKIFVVLRRRKVRLEDSAFQGPTEVIKVPLNLARYRKALIFVSVLNIFLSITAFLGNTLILVALHKRTSLNKPSKLLLRNLAVTDLCVGIIAEPLFVAYLMSVVTERWDICYYINDASQITGTILCSVSLFTSTAISVDRLLALILGLRYRHIVTMRKAHVSVFFMWVFSAL
ncbi:unnamed protein product, partial [Porites lobata]